MCYLSWSKAQFARGLGLGVRNLPEDKVSLIVSLGLLWISLRPVGGRVQRLFWRPWLHRHFVPLKSRCNINLKGNEISLSSSSCVVIGLALKCMCFYFGAFQQSRFGLVGWIKSSVLILFFRICPNDSDIWIPNLDTSSAVSSFSEVNSNFRDFKGYFCNFKSIFTRMIVYLLAIQNIEKHF